MKRALASILPDKAAFHLLATLLRQTVRHGTLSVIDPWCDRHVFGTGHPPIATIRLNDPKEPAKILADPRLRVGEAYMDGTLTVEPGDLRDFLTIGVAIATEIGKRVHGAMGSTAARRETKAHNTPARARKNVAHHYDLSEAFYRLFLDQDLQYSCAYFRTGAESLEEAQAEKKRHIAAKLLLQPGLRVLDIGSGWGGLALQLSQTAGVKVDGLTLSQEQLRVARERAGTTASGDKVRFHLRDYREESASYDRIVSVGMFEHVGAPHYDDFFQSVGRLLKPDGVALVHAIGQKGVAGGPDPWIEKYIFPGAYCPSLSEVFAAIEHTGLWVTDVEVLRLHYAETLRHWSERFSRLRHQAKAIYDERFCRMWEFYLAACEAAFRVGDLMVFQIQLSHSSDAIPFTRDYMVDEERRDRAAHPATNLGQLEAEQQEWLPLRRAS